MKRLLFGAWAAGLLLLVLGLGLASSTMTVTLTSMDPDVPATVQIESATASISLPGASVPAHVAEVVTPIAFTVTRAPYRAVDLAVRGIEPEKHLRIEVRALGQSAIGNGQTFVLSQAGLTGLGVHAR